MSTNYEETALQQIRERVGQRMVVQPGDLVDEVLVLLGALHTLLALHVPPAEGSAQTCRTCGGPWPCPSRQTIRNELVNIADVPAWTERTAATGSRF